MSSDLAQESSVIRSGRPSASFVRTAQRRGVRRKVAKALEPAALHLFPDQPLEALNSREAFEQAAAHAVLGDANNLELSYRFVDAFATALEALGLARATDVPDPFRRVWLTDVEGARQRGVVLRCERGEVAVFCPATHEPFTPAGPIFKMSYRGHVSSVEFELKLSDAVRLPEALVVHLARPEAGGSIGRNNLRVDVQMPASVRALGDVEPISWREAQRCEILDVSAGGLRIASELPFGAEQQVTLNVPLPDAEGGDLTLTAKICWNRVDDAGLRTQGLLIVDASQGESDRYLAFVSELLDQELEPEDDRADAADFAAPAAAPAPLSPVIAVPASTPAPAPTPAHTPAHTSAVAPNPTPTPTPPSDDALASFECPDDGGFAGFNSEEEQPDDEPSVIHFLPEEPRIEPFAPAPEAVDLPIEEPELEWPVIALDIAPLGDLELEWGASEEPVAGGPPDEFHSLVEERLDANRERADRLAKRVADLEAALELATARAEECQLEDHIPLLKSLEEQISHQSRDLEEALDCARVAQRRADARADELFVCRQELAERRSTMQQATDLVARLKPMLGAIESELIDQGASGLIEPGD